jgi:hypothetical protein
VTAYTLAIDPGRDGAAVLLAPDGRRAVLAWAWYQRKQAGAHVYDVEMVGPWEGLQERRCRSLPSVGRELLHGALEHGPFLLVVEGLFVPTYRAPEGALVLAEEAALVYSALIEEALSIERPLASEWRGEILGLGGNTSSAVAERAAIRACTQIRPLLVEGLGELATQPHVAEAACMARWGFLKQRPSQLTLGGRQ